MPSKHPVIKHFLLSLLVLIISLFVLLLTVNFLQDIFLNPAGYFDKSLTREELESTIVTVVAVVISVLVSLVIYLLLASQSSAELYTKSTTRWLAVEREKFRRVYDDAPVPYLMLDSEGAIYEPNKATLRFFGISAEQINSKDLFSFISEEDRAKGEKLLQNYKSGIPVDREEIRILSDNSRERWVLLSILEMKEPLTKKRVGLATVFDITEQKRLEKAKTEFVSLASHQLRSPIATIKWYTEMLLSGGVGEMPEKQNEYIKKLAGVSNEMGGLVETLLNISRIEMGTLPIEPKETDAKELTESILFELSPLIEKKKIRIERQYKGSLESLKTDPKLLRIVLQNLLSNAVKYTPDEGQVSVIFSERGSEKQISISDSGYGIPESEQDRVFTKLFRAENVRRLSTSQGTGLGLYLVKSIVETLGGKIDFVSEENKGTTFTLTLY